MGIVKLAEGAFVVQSYSTQTVVPSYGATSSSVVAGGAVEVLPEYDDKLGPSPTHLEDDEAKS